LRIVEIRFWRSIDSYFQPLLSNSAGRPDHREWVDIELALQGAKYHKDNDQEMVAIEFQIGEQ